MTGIRRNVAICAVLVAAAAACGGGDDDAAEPGSSEGSSDASVELDENGTLRAAWAGGSTNWDPHMPTNVGGDFVPHSLVYDRLLYLDADMKLEPMVATEWEMASDAAHLDLTLRTDVVFHDGTPLDAEAVKASLERAQSLEGSTVASQLSSVAGVDVVDASHVRVRLTGPTGDRVSLPYALAQHAGMIVNPASAEEPTITEPAGSGPYTFAAGDSDNLTQVFVRNDDYWDPEVPKVARYEVHTILDDTQRLNAFRAGQLDVVLVRASQYNDAEALAEGPTADLFEYETMSPQGLYLNTSTPGLDDPDVRRAISLAIDRQAISTALHAGKCAPTVQPLGSAALGYDAALDEAIAYDVDEAQTLLEDAGAEDLELSLLVGDSPVLLPVAEVVQEQLAEIGITVTISPIPATEIRTTWRQGDYDMNVNTILAGVEASFTMDSYLLENVGPVPDELTGLLDEAKEQPLESTERADAFRAVNAELAESPIHVPICSPATMWLANDKVVGADEIPFSVVAPFWDPRPLGMTS
ncbi:MAG TPA: ABC transporter substrate-binding protein [Acidimicrobiales bacterium]|nr:ABC transporter substrate-binding protein [Acidimicrobiales bacterium]